jgi:hypothetical protein
LKGANRSGGSLPSPSIMELTGTIAGTILSEFASP